MELMRTRKATGSWRLRKLVHLLTAVFVVGFIAVDLLDADLSDFSWKQGQIKRAVIIAEAPKSTDATELLKLPALQPALVASDAIVFAPGLRLAQTREMQRILGFRSRRLPVHRIIRSIATSPQSSTPA